MAVLETPWFLKTKTSDLRKVNQVFEERFQKQVTILDLKQRKSMVKIEEEIQTLRRDFRRIRSEVDFSTDLDKRGKKIDPDAARSKSTGDLAPAYVGEERERRPLTKSALFRHNKFVHALNLRNKIPKEVPIVEMLKEKYGEGREVKKLQAQLQQQVMTPLKVVRKKRKTRKKTRPSLAGLSTITDSDRDFEDICTNDDKIKPVEHLPLMRNSAKERRFSIATPRKRSHDQLPSINGVDKKLSKTNSYDISYNV